VGWDSVVSIPTCYGLGSSGIESWWAEIFHICPDCHWDPPSLPGVKLPGCVNHPPRSSAKVEARTELCLYSPSVPSHHYRTNFIFTLDVSGFQCLISSHTINIII